METEKIAAYAEAGFSIVLSLIAAGFKVYDLVQEHNEKIRVMQEENRDPNDAEWQALNEKIELLRGRLHSPNPTDTAAQPAS